MSGLSSLGLADAFSGRAHYRPGLSDVEKSKGANKTVLDILVDQHLKPILEEVAREHAAKRRQRERLGREVEESQSVFRERMREKHWCYL